MSWKSKTEYGWLPDVCAPADCYNLKMNGDSLVQMTPGGEIINVWRSERQVRQAMSLTPAALRRAVETEDILAGSRWSYLRKFGAGASRTAKTYTGAVRRFALFRKGAALRVKGVVGSELWRGLYTFNRERNEPKLGDDAVNETWLELMRYEDETALLAEYLTLPPCLYGGEPA